MKIKKNLHYNMKVVWVTDPCVYGVGCFKVSNLFSYMFKLGEVPKYRSNMTFSGHFSVTDFKQQ